MIKLKKTWRWFGKDDPVTLGDLRQMDVEGVVTALHDVPSGEVWTKDRLWAVKKQIEDAGLQWSVVESLPVSEGIKRHDGDYDRLTENYRQSLKHLGEQGINVVCYNFMPAIDWVRTDIDYLLPNGTAVMFFEKLKFMAFDLFILERPGALGDYSDEEQELARRFYDGMSEKESEELAYNIIVRTQAFIHGEDYAGNRSGYREAFLKKIDTYRDIDSQGLRENLLTFLGDVLPVAEAYGIRLCIHPDDPPFPLLGLPRIVSTYDDLDKIFSKLPSLNNGLTFCSGSLSIRQENNLEHIIETFADRIHFAHLRNNIVFANGDFRESGHLEGNANLPVLIELLMQEMQRRKAGGREDFQIPVRPDHGIKMLDDFNRDSPPGYPMIGRYRGLLEIAGVEAAIERKPGYR